MAAKQYCGEGPRVGAGAEEASGGKSNIVSSSPGGGGGGLGKRPAGNDDVQNQPAPPKILKPGVISAKKPSPISIKLGASKPKEVAPILPSRKPASVFDDDDDDSEPEEMPPEAKMRMKNIGRDTPTSAGPNSFNKGKQGFCDHQKLRDRKFMSQKDQ